MYSSRARRFALKSDLLESWEATLASAGFPREKRTLWIMEGVLMYLGEERARALLGRIARFMQTDAMLMGELID